jgi:hypothetical protein
MTERVESFNGCGCAPCGADASKLRWRIVQEDGRWTRETFPSEEAARRVMEKGQRKRRVKIA